LPPKRHLELGVKLTGAAAQGLDDGQRSQAEADLAEAYEALRTGVLALGGEVTEERQLKR
jgi:hypothetical protein